ncbi:MAG: hypothetical protein JSS86_21965, partial [Cyanobacteria bacterium SZAS LIN-2]|nr:hypothetical protein [Cyanobacteria bacterium SZAS LIN-2]
AQAPNIPSKQGVYALIAKPEKPCAGLLPEYLLYIGETTGQTLRKRFGQYIRGIYNLEERPKLVTTLPKYQGFLHFHFAEIAPGGVTPLQIEEKLLSSFLPPLNSKFTGIASTAVAAF